MQVKDSYRHRGIHSRNSLACRLGSAFDSCQGWMAAAIIGILTAIVAFLVDIAVASVSGYKFGYCRTNIFQPREHCCPSRRTFPPADGIPNGDCAAWKTWANGYWTGFGIYVGFAVAFGVISSSVTMLTKANLPAASQRELKQTIAAGEQDIAGKSMYMAAGSGIPEIKTILSGFVIPRFLDFKVLVVKAVGSVFAVATGMCLGKEGPFVHISTCIGYLVSKNFPKYQENGRKMREMLSVACSAGLSVAFGAPLGGVLFSYEVWLSSLIPNKSNSTTGDKYVLSSKGPLAGIYLLSVCCSGP